MKKITLLLSIVFLALLNTKAQESKMIKAASITVIPVDIPADNAWDVIAAVDGVEKWFGAMIKTCSVDGDTRVCGLENGTTFSESIILVDHQNMIFRYTIPSQPIMPIANLSAYMRVMTSANGKTYIEWSGNYDVKPEDKIKVDKMLKGAWQTGIKGIEEYVVSLN